VPLGRFDEPEGRRVALVAHQGVPVAALEPAERTVFVLGAEREGLSAEIVAECDAVATIPIADSAESLNVAIAGAIALYELHRD
jgi:tRNA G18 (ribose-2'-O)-methylase SpoU